MPIKYNYEVSVSDNKAKLNKDIFLFRGNRNIHYYFSIKGARFTFSKENENLLESSNAIYAAITVIKPNGVEVANAIAPVEDGLIHLKVTEDLIDEEVEVGDFDLVFDLFDDNEGAVTIPKIKGQFHVQERPCTTSIGTLSGNVNVVNQAVVDLAIATQENEQLIVVDDDGKYVKTTWVKGDKISIERLNKIEEGIEKNSTQYKDIANEKFDDITLSDNVLTFFANNKTIKTITLPTSTTGGGTNGKEIELQKSTTHIQWRYVGDTDWTNLVALVDLKGNNGLSAYELAQEQGFGGNVGQWLQSLVPNLQIGTVETLDSGSNATANITGTAQNPLLNLGIPKGENSTGGSNDTLVTTNISGTTLSLTTDKYQTATVVDGTEITLPTVTSFTEIHLFFGTTTDLTLMLPSCKWQNGNTPTISANKTYEFIFTYTTEWLGGVIAYE